MKKTIIAILLVTAGIAAPAANLIKKKPKVEILPEVIIPTTSDSRMHTHTIGFEFCPRDIENFRAKQELAYVEDSVNVPVYNHCKKCGAGVYADRENGSARRCTFCEALEEVTQGE